jgi:uncharacterized protein (DUF983 family)
MFLKRLLLTMGMVGYLLNKNEWKSGDKMSISVYDFCFRCPKCGRRRARCYEGNICLTKNCGCDLTQTIKETNDKYYSPLLFLIPGCIVFTIILSCLLSLAK